MAANGTSRKISGAAKVLNWVTSKEGSSTEKLLLLKRMRWIKKSDMVLNDSPT